MNQILRNFFYAVGIVLLLSLYGLDPAHASVGDIVRLVQSRNAQQIVLLLTVLFIAVEWVFGFGAHRRGDAQHATGGSYNQLSLTADEVDRVRGH